ncbi:substrate-binding domain-containing protein [Asaia platycodi]|uniref:substrate-binding domain-containing protein n=1 Tax=Asaia platycodi TaxID=610243 RepID=UPI0011DDEB82|nr:substrate-binding domain-containing protein [Asaia platycodi]
MHAGRVARSHGSGSRPSCRGRARSAYGRAQRRSGPDCVIALTNSITLGALRCLHQSGCAVPGDVSLVGYDDYAWMRATHPPITAIRQPVEEMGLRPGRVSCIA